MPNPPSIGAPTGLPPPPGPPPPPGGGGGPSARFISGSARNNASVNIALIFFIYLNVLFISVFVSWFFCKITESTL